MNRPFRRSLPSARLLLSVLAVLTALAGLPGLATAQQPNEVSAAGAPIRPGEPVTLNFANADIDAVARTMAAISGRNVVVDPRVKGTITLVTDKPVSAKAALNQFLAALRLQGFTMIDTEGLYKVVPEADAKLQSTNVSVSDRGGSVTAAGNQIVTKIFRLNFETANNLVPVLRPLISPNNTINVNPGTNSLVITDYADNLQRIGRIIAALDVSNASDVEIIPLKNAIATDLAPLILRLVETSGTPAAAGQGQADTSFKTTLIAEPRSNSLILRAANPARVALVKSLVERLDRPGADGSNPAGNIYVVYLKNADATKMAATLRAALSGEVRGSTTASAGSGLSTTATPTAATTGASTSALTAAGASVQASAQPSTGGQIQADPATNSLIITAPEPQYRQLRAVIDKLDGRRAQVLVESLIAEVSTDKAAQFGVQWQALLGNHGNNVGVLGTNFTNGGTNIFSLASSINSTGTVPASSAGGNFGIAHKTAGMFSLGALANLLQSTGDGNVLSTPTLLTLDNEEAKIVVGQNVPFVTGQYTNNNTSNGSVNPFTTVERKDVGLTLRVKPQISEDGTIKLTIYQEVSAVQASTLNNLNGPTTTIRSIASTVLVGDGDIVVLGGLLQDDYSASQQKVPGLGDVPLLGALFRSDTRERTKTNLMVFLRPVVVRDGAETGALSFDRYDLMRGVQQSAQPTPSVTVPVNAAPVMAPLPRPAAGGRPVPPPLLAPGLSGTWGSAPPAATRRDVTGSSGVAGASNLTTAPAGNPAPTPLGEPTPAQPYAR
ncbi:type II secretion system secretin GspD [Polaromonas sp. C04]|uniref:type II secretion system secretin GspD n=1 Tax=Polaromonas sp. C04 TaxID=1945857 RepID=UPI000984390F|nr:type II secretion system secretin GspD [Polaromonas sp. C04]OOG59231.1 type II secretion system protein GspD [Polaromonas sp. C04]